MSYPLTRGIRVLLSSLAVLLVLASPIAAALEVGDKAPNFSLQASDGNTYSMSQFIGEKPVVIAFFPKAFTGG
jgi:peroxiredoxin Q/BCP